MYEKTTDGNAEKNYENMLKIIASLIEDETDEIAVLSVTSSIINSMLSDLNWVGFYLLKDGELVVGPFQGEPPCIRIKVGKGVCGTAVSEKKTLNVPDVHLFDGHIACDARSNSELVAPIFSNGEVYAVLDIDSPLFSRFDATDEKYISRISEMLGKFLAKPV